MSTATLNNTIAPPEPLGQARQGETNVTELVTVDIGGTHARFAIATVGADGTITLGEPATLHTSDHASFQNAWRHFREISGGTLPPAVAMSVAGSGRR